MLKMQNRWTKVRCRSPSPSIEVKTIKKYRKDATSIPAVKQSDQNPSISKSMGQSASESVSISKERQEKPEERSLKNFKS